MQKERCAEHGRKAPPPRWAEQTIVKAAPRLTREGTGSREVEEDVRGTELEELRKKNPGEKGNNKRWYTNYESSEKESTRKGKKAQVRGASKGHDMIGWS